MRAVVQRVRSAQVTIDGRETRAIGRGLLILLGVAAEDTMEDARLLARKCAELRVFEDGQGKLNLSAPELGYEAMVVSNFTLQADTKKGRRPSFIRRRSRPFRWRPTTCLWNACAATAWRGSRRGSSARICRSPW